MRSCLLRGQMPGPTRQTGRVVMAGIFEVFLDEKSQFRFRLRAPDGMVLAVSAAFSDKAAAVTGIAAVRECAGMGLITDLCGEGRAESGPAESARSGGPLPVRQNWHRRADTFHTRAATIRRAASAARWSGAA